MESSVPSSLNVITDEENTWKPDVVGYEGRRRGGPRGWMGDWGTIEVNWNDLIERQWEILLRFGGAREKGCDCLGNFSSTVLLPPSQCQPLDLSLLRNEIQFEHNFLKSNRTVRILPLSLPRQPSQTPSAPFDGTFSGKAFFFLCRFSGHFPKTDKFDYPKLNITNNIRK